MRRLIFAIGIALALAAPGCKNGSATWWKKKKPPADTAAVEPALTPAEQEIERLREENRTLGERLTEVQNREKLLAKKVKQLELISSQRGKQLDAVGDAPLERDQYKARCERLEKHVKELSDQLSALMKLKLSQPAPKSN